MEEGLGHDETAQDFFEGTQCGEVAGRGLWLGEGARDNVQRAGRFFCLAEARRGQSRVIADEVLHKSHVFTQAGAR